MPWLCTSSGLKKGRPAGPGGSSRAIRARSPAKAGSLRAHPGPAHHVQPPLQAMLTRDGGHQIPRRRKKRRVGAFARAARLAVHDGLIRHAVAGCSACQPPHIDPVLPTAIFCQSRLLQQIRLFRQVVQGQQSLGRTLERVAPRNRGQPGMRREACEMHVEFRGGRKTLKTRDQSAGGRGCKPEMHGQKIPRADDLLKQRRGPAHPFLGRLKEQPHIALDHIRRPPQKSGCSQAESPHARRGRRRDRDRDGRMRSLPAPGDAQALGLPVFPERPDQSAAQDPALGRDADPPQRRWPRPCVSASAGRRLRGRARARPPEHRGRRQTQTICRVQNFPAHARRIARQASVSATKAVVRNSVHAASG